MADHGAMGDVVTPDAAGVRIEWAGEPAAAQPGQPLKLSYRVVDRASGQALTDLPVSHERPMHLIVVSKDLRQFQHVHPEPGADGAYSVTVTLPAAGAYVLYDEFVRDDRTVLDRRELTVGGTAGNPAALRADTGAKTSNGLTATLSAPRTIKAHEEAVFALKVTRDGQAVTDLAPYLGAAAHVAIVSADTTDFAHTHADAGQHGHEAAALPAQFGPDLSFEYTFPRPGFYKVWVQFSQGGTVHTVDYVVEVEG
jgi:hypothetical protein